MLSLYLQMLDNEEDKSRFERFYLLYRGLMYHVAMKLLHNEMDAEDAVHQAFLAILQHFSKIRTIDCPETRAYSVIITERKAIDLLRERKRLSDEEPEEFSDVPLEQPGDSGIADAGVKRDSVQKLLWRAKQALKNRMEGVEDEPGGSP